MERTENLTRASAPVADNDRSYIDWAAILGGAVVATAVATVFTTFGAALGLSALSAEPGEGSFNVAVILGGIWVVVTLVASYAAGGYIAGRMRRRVDQATSDEVTARDMINGLVVWGVGMLIGTMLLANAAGSALSAAGSAASTVVSATGSAVGGLAQGALTAAGAMVPDAATADPMGFVTNSLMRPARVDPATATPATLSGDVSAILANVLSTGEISDPDRAYLESAVAAQTGLTAAEVKTRVDGAITQAQATRDNAAQMLADAQQTAIDLAEAARVSGVLTAFLLAAAALVAAATSGIAAVHGGRHRDEGRLFGGFAYTR